MRQQTITQRPPAATPSRWTCVPRPGASFPSDSARGRAVDIRRGRIGADAPGMAAHGRHAHPADLLVFEQTHPLRDRRRLYPAGDA
jgi:hypothetical protein